LDNAKAKKMKEKKRRAKFLSKRQSGKGGEKG